MTYIIFAIAIRFPEELFPDARQISDYRHPRENVNDFVTVHFLSFG